MLCQRGYVVSFMCFCTHNRMDSAKFTSILKHALRWGRDSSVGKATRYDLAVVGK